MEFADIHIHALAAVDDGADSDAMMRAMVDAAYRDGTRVLCLTPHCHPGLFGDNGDKAEAAFARLTQYAGKKYPKLQLYLGNELRYYRECCFWLESGRCRTLGGTNFVLVDFSQDEAPKRIIRATELLMNRGYVPVLAHAERYRQLSISDIRSFVRNGVWIQLDAQSITAPFTSGARARAHRMIRERLAALVASDAHDMHRRRPGLSHAYQVTLHISSQAYADALFRENALALLSNN